MNAEINWNDLELKVDILQILHALRKWDVKFGGASPSELAAFCLSAHERVEMEEALVWLTQQNLIEQVEDLLMITVLGVDLLFTLKPPYRPDYSQAQQATTGGGGQSGWWQPPDGPDDYARVPRKPYPQSGSGVIVLPLPKPAQSA